MALCRLEIMGELQILWDLVDEFGELTGIMVKIKMADNKITLEWNSNEPTTFETLECAQDFLFGMVNGAMVALTPKVP